jgi:multidrug resistance efflux pump
MVPVTLLTMVDDGTRRVKAFVDESEISMICFGQRAHVAADAVRSMQMDGIVESLALRSPKTHSPEIRRGGSGR